MRISSGPKSAGERPKCRANRATFYENDKSMTWLTNYVLSLARSLPAPSRDLPFHVFDPRHIEDILGMMRQLGVSPETVPGG